MKEFVSAFRETEAEDNLAEARADRERRIERLVAEGWQREDAEKEIPEVTDRGLAVAFMLDGRRLLAYPPHEGQLIFMMAGLGRGQSKEQRLGAMVNVMMEALDEDDKDYFEGRLLTADPKERIGSEVLEQVFEYLTTEWFASDRPTKPSSGSAG